jgi:GMP synthase PP-ATPase subunit
VEVARAVVDLDDMPVLGPELCTRVVGEARVDVAVDGDAVVVVDEDEVVEAEVTSERDGLLTNTLLQAAVAGEAEDLGVAGDGEALTVVLGRDLLAGDGETDSVGDALAERTSRDLDAGELDLRVAGRDRAVGES